MHIDLQNRYAARARVVARRIGNQTLLVPISGETADLQRVFTLNAVAEYAWNRLDGQHTLADICSEIATEFDVTESDAQRDMLEWVAQLETMGLIEAAGMRDST